MTISLETLVRELRPANSVLFFGAGSSIPSGCPDTQTLCQRLIAKFGIGTPNLSLAELAGLIEIKTRDRRGIIDVIRASFQGKRPTMGLLTVPLFPWRCLYTTNYDELIEISYRDRGRELSVISSNFDFRPDLSASNQKLYKIHGTVGKDRSDGHQSSLILTDQDYDVARQQREFIYDRLAADLATSQLLVIGYSLNDPEIKRVIDKISAIQEKDGIGGQQYFLCYQADPDRAEILEARGFKVAFGGIDDFFGELMRQSAETISVFSNTGNPLDAAPALIPLTEDARHSIEHGRPNVSAMFNGRPATYSDISAELTFKRDVVGVAAEALATKKSLVILMLGASGVGKTTAARQLMVRLAEGGDFVWEHRSDNFLDPDAWSRVAHRLGELGKKGYLFADDAHVHLQQLNELTDRLSNKRNDSLVLILAAPRNSWNPRIKSPSLSKRMETFVMSQLSAAEIDRLLTLTETVVAIRKLVESTFAGFSRLERRRRLVDRCEADTFVCLKNVFASEGFDDIVLQEYGSLSAAPRDVYRVVAFLETCGVIVHRQLLVRLLGIPSDAIGAVLVALTDIVFEVPVDERDGVYAWRGRHAVISSIISKYKFADQADFVSMIERVINAINPAFPIELRSVREICSIGSGIAGIVDKSEQNRLLRMIISIAPGERVPRHRLIRNLIDAGDYPKAATEIRIFENDFRLDGPVARYKVKLMLARAANSPGLLKEDRVAILEQAVSEATKSASRFSHNKMVLASYCEVGVEYFKLTGDASVFDDAIGVLRNAEEAVGDPDIARLVAKYEARLSSGVSDVGEASPDEIVEMEQLEIE